VSGPVVAKYSWFYDVPLNDFVLKPINLLEETVGKTVTVHINDFEMKVPASWNLLIVDEETKMVDTVPITQCSSSKAFLMHPETHDYYMSDVVLLDMVDHEECTYVMIPRNSMMLHPCGPIPVTRWMKHQPKNDLSYCCLLSPQDLGKHMHGMSAMEVVL